MACWFFDFVLTELSLCVAATFVLKPVIFFFFNNYSVCMIFGMVILCSALSFFLFLFFFGLFNKFALFVGKFCRERK